MSTVTMPAKLREAIVTHVPAPEQAAVRPREATRGTCPGCGSGVSVRSSTATCRPCGVSLPAGAFAATRPRAWTMGGRVD